MATTDSATAPSSEIGSILGQRYEVVRELGRGGMGVVYLCRDTVTGDRVALKRLRTPDKGQARPEESWWFHQEARAVALLDHPAIVRARDFGQLADGSPFFVMDVLPGRSIHEWMHTTQMPWSVVWSMVDQVLAGLAHAHARGVIHGDLKPSNIMLDMSSSGRGPRAYLLDLGLAWLREYRHDSRLDGARAPEVAVHSGAGTVGWVAPEQIRRQAALVGPGTDLYALGCVMYRVMSGREVFEGNAQDVLRAHKRTPVPPPQLRDDTPADAGKFIIRLLEKKPWQRFDFAADARRAWTKLKPPQASPLEDIVAGQSPSSRTAPTALSRAAAPGLLALRAPMLVARRLERQELWSAVEAVASGKPRQDLVALIGEAGVGKSRLAEWLCAEVHERGLMVPLRARYGRIPTPLDGITAAVNAHFGLEGADRASVEHVLMARWEVAKDDDDALTWVAASAEWLRPTPPGVLTPVGPSGKRFVLDRPELRFQVLKRILERISRDRPVLLWLDDLHYASPNTFETLSRLRREAPEVAVMLVATARSETLATDLDAALRMEAMRAEWGGRVLDLKPLATDDTDVLLRAALPLHDSAVRRAIEQSRGNPLFALQLLYAWAGGGYLTLDGDKYGVPDEALQGRPITTAELWDERVRAISTELRLSAYAAAALGDDVRGDVLKTLCASLGMDPRDALVALTRGQILLATGNDQFRWPHALLQEHLLERLQERKDAPAVYRLAANALARHPGALASRRIMKHRVQNLLKAGDDDTAAKLMLDFIRGSWRRGRDTAATLRDLELLDGRLSGAHAAEGAFWRAEALRYAGRLDEARAEAEKALAAFRKTNDRMQTAAALRLLGHIASDRGQPAQGRSLVSDAVALYEQLGDEAGRAQAEVVLGEIDYLLGDHARARATLKAAIERCTAVGDVMGRAQSLIFLALIEEAVGGFKRGRSLLGDARSEFDGIGYRLGIAQCDVALGHADHRSFDFAGARARALAARAAFREVQNPRGEAACERLLAMVAFDTNDHAAGDAHARVALKIYERLQDPWGQLEARLLLAQVSLARGEARARELVAACDALVLDEAEPRQHRHLTRAWLAQQQGRWADAAMELEAARAAFPAAAPDAVRSAEARARTGDHTPHLLNRFAKLEWSGESYDIVEAWLQNVEAAGGQGVRRSVRAGAPSAKVPRP